MTATLIGATGLIGNYLLEELLKDEHFDTVRILVRRPFQQSHSRLEKKLVDFADNDSLLVALSNSDVIFCSIGTTQKKVKGDKEAYRKIDFDIPVKLARFCKMTGCEKFILVSAVGASSKSNNFYLKLKGEVEDAVKEIGLKSVHIMRPSMLLGKRSEVRRGERIAQIFMKVIWPLFSWGARKYQAIPAKDVAKSMLAAAKKNEEGVFVYEYKEIKKLSK